MKPIDKTDASQTDAVSFEFDLPHSAEKVWRALTDPALLTEWLLPVCNLELEPGAKFTFAAQPQPGWDGAVHCQVLEIEERRKLSYSWNVADMDIDTVVTFTLTPTESGTRMSLLQSGFGADQKRNFAGARYGWKMMGQKLVALLDRLERSAN